MFEIGFSEILVISAIALVVLGPEKLPKLAAQVGRWTGRARAMARQLRLQLEQEAHLQEVMRAAEEAKKAASFSTSSTPQPPVAPVAPGTPAVEQTAVHSDPSVHTGFAHTERAANADHPPAESNTGAHTAP